jgi:hypothetical protein
MEKKERRSRKSKMGRKRGKKVENVGMYEGETRSCTMCFSRARQKSDEAEEMSCKEEVLRHERKWNNTLCVPFFLPYKGDKCRTVRTGQYTQDIK